MGIFDTTPMQESPYLPYLNTGTLLDVVTGKFVNGTKGEMILNGGLTYTTAGAGKPQLFKSTTAMSLLMNVLARYKDSVAAIYDSEYSQDLDRIIRMSDIPIPNVDDRVKLTTSSQYMAEDYFEWIKSVHDDKIKRRKDFEVETPFIDPRTNKPRRMMIPTLIAIDSWSKLRSRVVMNMLAENEASSSDTNMVYMKEGNIKTKLMSQIPKMAVDAGLFFFLTAHVGNKFDMNPYAPSTKDLQYMKGTDKIKGVGSDFLFLISTLIEWRSATVLQKDKECMYPDKYSSATEYSGVTGVTVRCKNNGSGSQLLSVVSQSNGMNTPITNYHYLKENKYFGLTSQNPSHATVLQPNDKFGRTTISDRSKEYKIGRALEILAQICYIKNNWSLRNVPIDLNIDLDKFAETLVLKSGYSIDTILESRGYWTYDKEDPRDYLSVMDILRIYNGGYKPKLHGVKTPEKKAA